MPDMQEERKLPQQKKKKRKRLPKWARVTMSASKIIAVPLFCIIALYAGLVIGYSYLGGQSSSDVMQPSTWKHLYDLVFAN